jgi:predicted NAD/FAD-dependent oxidoreductase
LWVQNLPAEMKSVVPSSSNNAPIFIVAVAYLYMIRRTASLTAASSPLLGRIKVAIVGSGMTGVTVASTLLDEIKSNNKLKLDITIYEAGRGIGGRMSTRYTATNDDTNSNGLQQQRLQFDHGCQYIGPAKTEEFKLASQTWNQRGWIKEWKGKFGRIDYTTNNNNKQGSDETTSSSIGYEETTNNTIRYVGYPRMNSICENIISQYSSLADAVVSVADHLPSHEEENIPSTLTVIPNTRIQHATSLLHNSISKDYSSTNDNCYYKGSRMWQLASEKKKHNTTTKNENESLVVDGDAGYYDWLVVTDRNSARSLIHMHDNDNDQLSSSFITSISGVEYIPICTTMITLNQPLTSIPVDGIEFSPNMEDNFGSLGWIARDSSKPGRRRHNNNNKDDKRESWILQSTSLGGKAMLDTMKGHSINQIREGIRKTMVDDFLNAIPHLISVIGEGNNVILPTVIDSVGHRWGAAFPIKPLVDMDSYIDTAQQLVVCGTRHGRVEGAFQSGRSAAQKLIRQI